MKAKKSILFLILAVCVFLPGMVLFAGCDNGPKNNDITITLQDKVYDGNQYTLVAEAVSNDEVILEYKLANQEDDAYVDYAPTDVGDYVVRATVPETKEYKAFEKTATFSITPKEVTVEWTAPENLVYNKTAKVPTVAITNGVVEGDVCNVQLGLKADNDNVNVGTFAYTAALSNSNYKLAAADVEKSYTITPRRVTVQWTAPSNLVYSKSAKVPTIAIGGGVVDGDTCEVQATLKDGDNNVNAGTFTYYATLNNPNYYVYEVQDEQMFTITQKEVTLSWGNAYFTYDRTEHAIPEVIINSGLIEGDECDVLAGPEEGEDNVNAGTFWCSASLSNSNYAIEEGYSRRSYSISKAYYPIFNGRYKRVGSDSYVVNNLQVGETVEFDLRFNDNSINIPFEGEITFTVYAPYTTGAAIVEGNLVTITKYGLVYIEGHVAESRNYYGADTNGVQRITIEGLDPVEGEQYTLPTDLTATYGETLADVELPDGFTWNNTDTSVGSVGTRSFGATFTPQGDDANIYKPKTVSISVTVEKATPEFVAPENLEIPYGTWLAGSTGLPDGYYWAGSNSAGDLGEHTLNGSYNPDITNYNTVYGTITYTVVKADQEITLDNESKEYDGDAITLADLGLQYKGDGEVTIEYKLAGDPDTAYSTTAPNAAHDYVVRITVAESTNYKAGVATFNFSIVLAD